MSATFDLGCLRCLRALGIEHDDDQCPRCCEPCPSCLRPAGVALAWVDCDDAWHLYDRHKNDDDWCDLPAGIFGLVTDVPCDWCGLLVIELAEGEPLPIEYDAGEVCSSLVCGADCAWPYPPG